MDRKQTIELIAKRDSVSTHEAADIVNEALSLIQEHLDNDDMFGAEETWLDCTGLEIEYFLDCLA